MKTLNVIPYMHPDAGGPPVVVDRFAREFVRRGHDVTVMSTDALAPDTDDSWKASYDGGYELEVFPAYRRRVFGYSPRLKAALDARVGAFDIVHLHNLWGYTNIAGTWACRKRNVPFVVSTHGMLDPNSLTRKSLKKALYGRYFEFPKLRQANGMIFTHAEEQRLANLSCPGLPPGYVVPLGADEPPHCGIEEAKAAILTEHPELADKQLVLFFGRIHPKKGIDVLIPGFAKLLSLVPEAHLVLAGPFGPGYESDVRSLIERCGIQRHVSFLGPVYGEQKWAVLSLSDVFVLPSYQENFAITVVEAMRMGLPVILSDYVNIVDDIVAAKAGLRTEMEPNALAGTLARVLTNKDERAKFSRNGPRLVEERFTWTVATDALLESYKAVLGANATPVNACEAVH